MSASRRSCASTSTSTTSSSRSCLCRLRWRRHSPKDGAVVLCQSCQVQFVYLYLYLYFVPGPDRDSRRALASAKYRAGPNGYRRPSLVRATSLEAHQHQQGPALHRLSEFQGRHPASSAFPGGRSSGGRGGGEGSGRKLPSRPSSFSSRTSYSVEQDGWHSRASGNPGNRRPPLLRHNSNLHRKMSYRQSNNNLEGYSSRHQRSHSTSYRRYDGGGQGGGGYLDERAGGGGWSVADFQRQASIEDRAYERRRLLVRQHSHRGELD